MTIRSVDHAQLPIPVGASAQARAFYEGLLGLPEMRHSELDKPGTLRFSLSGQRLDLSEGLYPGVAPRAHIALRVQDLQSLTKSLQACASMLPRGRVASRASASMTRSVSGSN